jgi:hypothetical protein
VSSDLVAKVAGRDDVVSDYKVAIVRGLWGMMDMVTLGRSCRSRLTKFLQHMALAGHVFCLLVGGAGVGVLDRQPTKGSTRSR